MTLSEVAGTLERDRAIGSFSARMWRSMAEPSLPLTSLSEASQKPSFDENIYLVPQSPILFLDIIFVILYRSCIETCP